MFSNIIIIQHVTISFFDNISRKLKKGCQIFNISFGWQLHKPKQGMAIFHKVYYDILIFS